MFGKKFPNIGKIFTAAALAAAPANLLEMPCFLDLGKLAIYRDSGFCQKNCWVKKYKGNDHGVSKTTSG
jgi:hypothetical protein